MHITVVATDFDGTISQGDQLAPEAGRALRRLREAGRFTVLVSGRPFEFLHDLQDREQTFDLIVAENGAVLYDPRSDEMRLPFGEAPADLLNTLERLGVPLWRGIAAAGTTTRYDDAVWVASRELGLAVHVEANRNEVMLLPPGASKGAGLLLLLKSEGLSPRNLLTFGDAENDASLLGAAEVKVAVANAVEGLKAMADYVTPEHGPAGVFPEPRPEKAARLQGPPEQPLHIFGGHEGKDIPQVKFVRQHQAETIVIFNDLQMIGVFLLPGRLEGQAEGPVDPAAPEVEIEATLGVQALGLAFDTFSDATIHLHQDLAGRDRLLEIMFI